MLGGSFNPAHDGHRHLSLEALRRLRLDRIWWLVSPQNPLKARNGMAPLAQRIAEAERVARHPRITVTGVESRLGTVYTAETLHRLKRLFPRLRFVWLMGADNLAQIHHWRHWRAIFGAVPIAVFDRASGPAPGHAPMASPAARRFARNRISDPGRLALSHPPAWIFLHNRLHPASATAIRAARKKDKPRHG